MEAKNIIYGTLALAVVGGGAYLFLKNKKSKDSSKLAELEKLGQGLTTGGTTAGSTTTPDKVLASAPVTVAQAQATQQETSNQIQAQALASQIFTLLGTKVKTFDAFKSNDILKDLRIDVRAQDLKNKMKTLGYDYQDGLAVKI